MIYGNCSLYGGSDLRKKIGRNEMPKMKKNIVFAPIVIMFIIAASCLMSVVLDKVIGNANFLYMFFVLIAVLGFFFGGVPALICAIIALFKTCRTQSQNRKLHIGIAVIEIIICIVWICVAGRAFYYGQSI